MKKIVLFWFSLIVVVLAVTWITYYTAYRPGPELTPSISDSQPAKSEQIKIGAILPLSGPSAQYGKWAQQAIELARSSLQKEHDIKVEVIYEDSQSDPKTAVSAYRAMAAKSPLCVLTGVSGVVLAVSPVAEEVAIPQINISGQNPDISDAGHYTISLINLATAETTKMAEYAYTVLGLRRVGIIYSNAAAGTGAANQLRDAFTQTGGSIVGLESYDDAKTDFRAQIAKVFSNKPEAVFAPGVSMNIARVIKQATEMGYKTQWLSYSGFEGPEVASIAGSAAEGTIYTSTELVDIGGFIGRYQSEYGSNPELYASTAYDAVHAIYQAYASGAHTSDQLVATLTSGSFEFHGVTGTFSIDQRGIVHKPVLFKIYESGVFQKAAKQMEDHF